MAEIRDEDRERAEGLMEELWAMFSDTRGAREHNVRVIAAALAEERRKALEVALVFAEEDAKRPSEGIAGLIRDRLREEGTHEGDRR